MSCNPFLIKSWASQPVKREICQRIQYVALRTAESCSDWGMLPSGSFITQLCQRARLLGPDVYITPVSDIDRIFAGVTLAVYQAVETLYCDRLGRSIQTVWRILNAMASQARKQGLEYEAVWAICMYLNERKEARSDVTIEQAKTTWRIMQTTPDVHTRDSSVEKYRPSIVCVVELVQSKVIAFRIIGDEDSDNEAAMAVYDAIVSQRRPASEGAAGLIWSLPAQLETEIDLAQRYQDACRRIGISITHADDSAPLPPNALRNNWARDLVGRTLWKEQLAILFDNYLERSQGYGPLRERKRRKKKFLHLVGYNRDPAWQFPALCSFLPTRESTISEDGTAEYDGLHYENELFAYWSGQQVILRRSETAEALAWVYLDGEILCQALARELRRRDGTYRANRPRR